MHRSLTRTLDTSKADGFDAVDAQEIKKKRTFKKFTFRGVDLEQLLELNNEQVD